MLLKNASIQDIVNTAEALQVVDGEVVMLLIGEENAPDIPSLIAALYEKNIPFFGGVFPGVIYANHWSSEGCVLLKNQVAASPILISDIASKKLQGLQDIDSGSLNFESGTALILLDGLTTNIGHLLEKLNESLGGKCRFIGAGAGSIHLQQKPCVFTKDGFKEDAAVVCIMPKEILLGVRHGWEKLAGPLVATATKGNVVSQLNWRAAIDVYREIVERDCGKALTMENFLDISPGYPFGIFREKEDDIVRDPLAFNDKGEIVCIGEVRPNTVLHVLKGHPDGLLLAARKAIHDCGASPGNPINAQSTFIVECITRNLFLGEQFAQEIDLIRENLVVQDSTQEPCGVLSLGEIASYGDGLLELFNKTIVVGIHL
jgi:hypothetical protein